MFRYLKNLSSTELFDGDPWEIPVEAPEEVKTDKKKRDEWANRKSTKGCFYTLWEGVNKSRRISAKAENPPHTLHGLVFDFDKITTDQEIEEVVNQTKLPVYFAERTLTPGYWRMACLFEKPLTFDSEEMIQQFLKHVLKTYKIGGGLDKAAFFEPNRVWTSGGKDRFTLRGDIVTGETVERLYAGAFKNYKFAEFSENITVPFDEISKALAEKYPDFVAKWAGPFEVEAQGPTFWIPESTSPKSAIVKPNGMFTFSAHAHKKFYSWRELLGSKFIDDKETDLFSQIGQKFARTTRLFFYHDPKSNSWKNYEKDDVRAALREMGLSPKLDDSNRSPIDRGFDYIRNNRWVDGAAPILFKYEPIVKTRDGRVLVNQLYGRQFLSKPSGQKEVWGSGGNFPLLSKFLETLFAKDDMNELEPLVQFLAWLKRYYEGALSGKPTFGHAIFILGPAGVGKSFLVHVVLASIFGRVADCADFLINNERFGGELLEAPIWSIDDTGKLAKSNVSRSYTMRIKELVARPNFDYHIKYQVPISCIDWNGRMVICCNLDPKSARSFLPETDHSNRDKMMFFRTVDSPQVKFGTHEENWSIVTKEIPHFLQYLLDYEIPQSALAEGNSASRFGVKPYYDSVIESLVRVASPKHTLASIIRNFSTGHDDDEKSEYQTHELYETLSTLYANSMRHYSPVQFVQQLETLAGDPDSNIGLEKLINENEDYTWRILK